MTAIHINPGGPAHGRFHELAETLRGNHVPPPVIPAPAFANANNAGSISVFGCRVVEAQPFDYEPNGYHFLIGIVRLGVWEVHVQKHNPINRRSARWQVSYPGFPC